MFRKTFPVGRFQCNCSILADEQTKQAIVVDPGDELSKILMPLAEQKFLVVAIVHTHAHLDHFGATADLARVTTAKTYLHPDDNFLHALADEQAQLLGLAVPPQGTIDMPLKDDMSICFGQYELAVMHTPGHTPGSCCFHVLNEDLCLAGDTLFAGGIGRTDLWGGDEKQIVRSIEQRLYRLNGAVQVIPGHGPMTSIDRERQTNPFVRLASS